jgi:hypothetical protein
MLHGFKNSSALMGNPVSVPITEDAPKLRSTVRHAETGLRGMRCNPTTPLMDLLAIQPRRATVF